MNIITKGNKNHVIRFTCKHCNCVYEAEKSECRPHNDALDVTYYSNCPECFFQNLVKERKYTPNYRPTPILEEFKEEIKHDFNKTDSDI